MDHLVGKFVSHIMDTINSPRINKSSDEPGSLPTPFKVLNVPSHYPDLRKPKLKEEHEENVDEAESDHRSPFVAHNRDASAIMDESKPLKVKKTYHRLQFDNYMSPSKRRVVSAQTGETEEENAVFSSSVESGESELAGLLKKEVQRKEFSFGCQLHHEQSLKRSTSKGLASKQKKLKIQEPLL